VVGWGALFSPRRQGGANVNPECGAFFNPCSNFLVTCDNYFDSLVIKKASAREWELKLKKILWDWCKNGYVRDEANRVLAELAYVSDKH